jgi:hypothetical protein
MDNYIFLIFILTPIISLMIIMFIHMLEGG